MIVGNGSIAKMLNDREGAIFFASGVSNSQCEDYKEMYREYELLESFKGDERSLFYFSSIGAWEFPKGNYNSYYVHKRVMETNVRIWFKNFNIIRLGNIWECTNPNTFRNYLKAHPEAEVKDEYRYMIHKEQLQLLTDNLPLIGKNQISVFGEMKKVKDCL